MNRTEERSSAALAGVLAVLGALLIADLASDIRVRAGAFHLAVEGSAILACAIGAAMFVRRVRDLARDAHALRRDLAESRADAARWRADAGRYVQGLSEAIDRQLEQWQLSSAEKEVALLLLKGLGHKEIAVVRDVSETTVRQQARAIYKKAQLAGRHELAAFFLEDLLGPTAAAPASRCSPPRASR